MKHTNDVNNVEDGQNVNTLSEIEKYYKAREQQLLKKLHRQEAALAAAEQTLKRLNENQKAPMDETTEQRTAQEQAFKEKLYHDPLTGIYNRRYYEDIASRNHRPRRNRADGCGRFQDLQRHLWTLRRRYGTGNGGKRHPVLHPERRTCSSATAGMNFCWCCPAFRATSCKPSWSRSEPPCSRHCTRLFAFSPLAEHRRNDAGHHRPDGECGSPGGLADVSGKVPQECRHGGGSRA